ncbi:hypothetical protein CR513_62033, partial [Mucuna pruriens]
MEAPLPKGWRGVYLDKYNGTSNLDEHLTKYVTQQRGCHTMSNILNLLEGVDLTLKHPIACQLNQLIHNAETEVQHTIFDQSSSPSHPRSHGQPTIRRK